MTRLSIPKYVSFLAVLLLAAPVARADSAERYEAVFSDGTRLEGDKVSGWHEYPGSPRLDNTALFDAKRPLRWLHDRRGKSWRPSARDAYIEFVGGDRIVGRIEGVVAGDGLYTPAHLLVRPVSMLYDPAWKTRALVRILPGRIERVVFRSASRRRLQPGTLYDRDGQRLRFLHLRWKEESVVLLLKDGTREVQTSQITEVHLPQIDPWQAYYQELAILNPSCRSRMVRIETTGGLIATASSLRLAALPYATDAHQKRAAAHVEQLDRHIAGLERQRKAKQQKLEQARAKYQQQLSESKNQGKAGALKRRFEQETQRWEGFLRSLESARSLRASTNVADGNSDTWSHIFQPVWSLDPLWVPFGSIRTRWSFAPEQVPLYRVRPVSTVSPPFLPPCTNRNSAGRPLRSGGDEYAWGFAVHAYSELRFPLPKFAKAFRSRIGLDRVVDSGGCARARVYVGSTGGKPAYESPLLIGSKKTADTGPIALNLPPEGPGLLVLQADPATRDGPPDADPLNIRDKLDWLDPRIELDTAALQEQVRRQVGPLIAGSPRWALRLDRHGVYTWTSRLDTTQQPGVRRFWTMLQAREQPLGLWREMKIAPADKWLAVHLGFPVGENPRADAVALRVGKRLVQARTVPVRQLWQSRPAPLLFPLDEYQGKKLALELIQPAGGKPLRWQAVSTLGDLPPAYRLAELIKLIGKKDMQVPYELGRAMQSSAIAKQEKVVALEINQLGGIVNFRPYPASKGPLDKLSNILLGSNWIGGDTTFIKTHPTFKKLPDLKTLVVTRGSGVSDGAIAKLQAEMPKLSITRIIPRTPSYRGGKEFGVTRRNLTGRHIIVLYVAPKGKLLISGYLKPWQVMPVKSTSGSRLEAHYLRKDYTRAEQYMFSLPLTTCHSTPDVVWDIRPVGK